MAKRYQKQFSEILKENKKALEHWADAIPVHQTCIEVKYNQGEEIGNSITFHHTDLSNPIGIVLEGRVELYESYKVIDFTSYRPIRVLGEGELFGDFSILDHHLGCAGPAKRGEEWKLCAGKKSILIKQRVNSRHPFMDDSGSSFEPHLFLDHNLSDQAAKVVFIDSGFIKTPPKNGNGEFGGRVFFEQLIRYSWIRAKVYRNCLNSFNFNELLKFRENAIKIYDSKLKQRDRATNTAKYSKAGAKQTLLPTFVEAVWDACNRPIRGEPMFVAQSLTSLAEETEQAFEKLGINLDNVLIALPDVQHDEMWFPLDKNNYLLAAYAKAYIDSSGDLQETNFITNFNNILGSKTSMEKNTQKQANNKKRNPRTLYLDLAKDLISEITNSNNDYPYKVTCKDVDGLDGRLMLLHFEKRSST